MSRIIEPEGGASFRNKLLKSISITILALTSQVDVNDETKDMLSFIILCMQRIIETIDVAVNAWEKRGYWLKADHFRLEWEWVRENEKELREALFTENWLVISQQLSKTVSKVNNIKISDKSKKAVLWSGAYKIIKNEKK
jgi:hypothetical protein